MISKLALGTVQFGAVYGINNKTGRVAERDADVILRRAYSAGVDTLDTSQAYGESEAVLGRILRPDAPFKVISKFIAAPGATPRSVLAGSNARLNAARLYAFLYHRFSDFREYPGWYEEFLRIKAGGAVAKIGFSVYYPGEASFLLDSGVKFDIVQLPYSVFDRRFEPLLPALREAGVEIHVRSVFLQGLVFMKPAELPSGLAGIKGKLERLRAVSEKSGIPVSALCLCFGLLNYGIDRVVIGVDGLADLESSLAGAARTGEVAGVYDELSLLREEDEEIILPFKWKK